MKDEESPSEEHAGALPADDTNLKDHGAINSYCDGNMPNGQLTVPACNEVRA